MMGLGSVVFAMGFLFLTAAWADPGGGLRVVTYNVGLGFPIKLEKKLPRGPLKRRYSMAHLLSTHRVLRDFDILGVQEICQGQGPKEEQLEYFREILRQSGQPVYSVFAAANPLATDRCKSGQMILSRHPIVASGSFELPVIRPGGKVVVWADIEVPQAGAKRLVRVYDLHLDNRGASFFAEQGRLVQMRAVLAHYLDWRRANPDAAAIILGDFNALNEWYNPWVREAALVETMKILRPSLNEYRVTHVSLHQLDWIFYDKLELVDSRVVKSFRSDHLPLRADFR